MDKYLVPTDFDTTFPWPSDWSSKEGLKMIWDQSYDKERMYQQQCLFSKFWSSLHAQKGLPVVVAAHTTPDEWRRRLDRRRQLRSRACKTQHKDDMIAMILEWGGEFRSALSLPAMGFPGERYVPLEDSHDNLDSNKLAAFRCCTKPEGDCGLCLEKPDEEKCEVCMRTLVPVQDLKLDFTYGDDVFDFELYYGKVESCEQRRQEDEKELKRGAASQLMTELLEPISAICRLTPRLGNGQPQKRLKQDNQVPGCDSIPTATRFDLQQPQQRVKTASQSYGLSGPDFTSSSASHPSLRATGSAQPPQRRTSLEVSDDQQRPRTCAPILQQLPSSHAQTSTDKVLVESPMLVE